MRANGLLLLLLFVAAVFCVEGLPRRPSSSLANEEHKRDASVYGSVSFNTSCPPGDAQTRFNQAVAMLHSFWYSESMAEFQRLTVDYEASCPMAYWGVAMTLWNPLWDPPTPEGMRLGREAVDNGLALLAQKEKGEETGAEGVLKKERRYMEALRLFYQEEEKGTDWKSRVERYEEAMQSMHEEWPEDEDLAAFYALATLSKATWMMEEEQKENAKNKNTILHAMAELTPDGNMMRLREEQLLPSEVTLLRAGKLLERIWANHPEHPGIIHLIIHAYDTPYLAGMALPAALKYRTVASGVPHALHMSSHTFSRMGLWQNVVPQEQEAMRVDEQANKGRKTSSEYMHSLNFENYALLQMVKDEEVEARMEEIMKKGEKKDAFDESQTVAVSIAVSLLRYYFEGEHWKECRDFTLDGRPKTFPWENFAWKGVVESYARTMCRLFYQRDRGAKVDDETRNSLREMLEAHSKWIASPAAAIVQNTFRRTISMWVETAALWVNFTIEERRAEPRDYSSNTFSSILQRMRDVVDNDAPEISFTVLYSIDQMGSMLLKMGKTKEALQVFQRSLQLYPNHLQALAGALRASHSLYLHPVKGESTPKAQRKELSMQYAKKLWELCNPLEDLRQCGRRKIFREMEGYVEVKSFFLADSSSQHKAEKEGKTVTATVVVLVVALSLMTLFCTFLIYRLQRGSLSRSRSRAGNFLLVTEDGIVNEDRTREERAVSPLSQHLL
ncbi:TPR repeat-containing protein [Balamuthia mandrillaris]